MAPVNAPQQAPPAPAGTDRAVAALPFPEAEWQAFRAEDKHAAAAIVCIMATIFTVGLLLYATIALIVAGG